MAGNKTALGLTGDRAIRRRLIESLQSQRHQWRTLGRLATEAAIPLELAADYLPADLDVRFAKGKSGEAIVGLRSLVNLVEKYADHQPSV